jgi:hypothetical protein
MAEPVVEAGAFLGLPADAVARLPLRARARAPVTLELPCTGDDERGCAGEPRVTSTSK